MIRTRLAHAVALAALFASPAFAQSTTEQPPLDKAAAKQQAAAPHKQMKADGSVSSTTTAKASAGTKSVDGANVAPLEKNSAKQQAAADCADHPQAGKLADKSTGEAKEHSASPVHMDCAANAKPKVAKKKSTKTASSK